MNRQQKREIAKMIAKIEKSDSNTSEKLSQIEFLVKDCSIEDLLEIDAIINEKYFDKIKFL